MNEVEKMYENAGIEPVLFYDCESYNQKVEKGYLFTADKQLSLIKWVAHKAHNGLLINKHITNGGASMVFDNLGYESTPASSFISFEECLANLVNKLWQDLTDAERKQIKEILSE